MWRLSEHRNVSWRFSHRNGNKTKYVKILLQIVLKCLIWHSLYFDWNLLSLCRWFCWCCCETTVVFNIISFLSLRVKYPTEHFLITFVYLHYSIGMSINLLLKKSAVNTDCVTTELLNKRQTHLVFIAIHTKKTLHNIGGRTIYWNCRPVKMW